ncbi:MAG: hypothetical protein BRD23_04195 [Halobacteriales archaeon SW_9_67_25]|jgi:uncharacterized membrane protein|nr:MAG: hypothetical protein BRD23_04195 [Halobacteriales archaeon SW_9_67_25]
MTWKRDFASGLIVLMPLLVTIFVLLWLYNRLAQIPIPVASPPLRVALTLVVFVMLVFGIGYLMRTAAGAVFETALDDLMNRLPGLRVVYNASKMAVETAVSGAEGLQTPVKIEPWPGVRMTAFKTGKKTADGRDVLFFPTAPNITTGFVVEMYPEEYQQSEESVEDALTRLLSAGFGETSEEDLQSVLGDPAAPADADERARDADEDAEATETA